MVLEKSKFRFYTMYFVLFCIEVVIHYKMNLTTGDFNNYYNWAHDQNLSLINWSINRYMTWTSRSIIDFILLMILKLPLFFWILADSLLITLSVLYTTKIVSNTGNNIFISIVLILSFFMIPYIQMSSAGWIPTTLNYMWPLSSGIVSLYYFKCIRYRIKISRTLKILSTIFLTYAVNNEQILIIFLGVYGSLIAYDSIKSKKFTISRYEIIQCIILLISFFYVIFSPGNHARSVQEVNTWFPDYFTYTFFEKLMLGSLVTFKMLFISKCDVFFIFLLLLFLTVCTKCQNVLYKILSIFPIFMLIFFNNAYNFSPKFQSYYKLLNEDNHFIKSQLYNWETILVLILFLCLILTILFLFSLISNMNGYFYSISTIFLLGLFSKIILGFSPTVFASGDRTGWFMEVLFLFLIGLILSEIKSNNTMFEYVLIGICLYFGLSNMLFLFFNTI